MALIQCGECSKEISDKAVSCPGCGCPMGQFNQNQSLLIDCTRLDKEQLWLKAYNLHYKGVESDRPIVIEMYKYIVTHYKGTKERDFAHSQLRILSDSYLIEGYSGNDVDKSLIKSSNEYSKGFSTHDLSNDHSGSKGLDNDLVTKKDSLIVVGDDVDGIDVECSKCSNHTRLKKDHMSYLTTGYDLGSAFVCPCGNSYDVASFKLQSNDKIYSIPTHGGLVALACVLGAGLLGGFALGSYFGTKDLIAKGDYDAALKSSNHTFWCSVFTIVVVPLTALLCFLSIYKDINPH